MFGGAISKTHYRGGGGARQTRSVTAALTDVLTPAEDLDAVSILYLSVHIYLQTQQLRSKNEL